MDEVGTFVEDREGEKGGRHEVEPTLALISPTTRVKADGARVNNPGCIERGSISSNNQRRISSAEIPIEEGDPRF